MLRHKLMEALRKSNSRQLEKLWAGQKRKQIESKCARGEK